MYARSIGYEDEHRGQEQNSSTQCHNSPDIFPQEFVARLSRHSSRVTLERVYGIVRVLSVRTCSSRSVSELQLKPQCLYEDRSPRRMDACGLLFSRKRLTQTENNLTTTVYVMRTEACTLNVEIAPLFYSSVNIHAESLQ